MRPKTSVGEIIYIGKELGGQRAKVTKVYTEQEKQYGSGDLEVVYFQNRLKFVRENVFWENDHWEFVAQGPSGLVDDRDYPELR